MKNLAKGLIIPAMLTMVACEVQVNKSEKRDKSVELPKTLTTKRFSDESESEYINRQVRMGEILAQSPIGFTHAKNVFDDVLRVAPGNDKALFYSALLDIATAYKGVGAETKNLWENKQDYDSIKAEATKKTYPEYVDYIFGGTEGKYRTIGEAFEGITEKVRNSFKSADEKLGRIDQSFEIILTQLKADTEYIQYDCETTVGDNYSSTSCNIREEMTSLSALNPKKHTVDVNDAKVIRGGLKGILTYARLLSAYSVDGAKEFSEEIKAKEAELGRELTDQENNAILNKYGKLMTLSPNNELPEVISGLEEIVEIGMDLEALNNRYCETGLRESNLVKNICFEAGTRQEMENVLDRLSGPSEVTLGLDKDGNEVKILVDLPGFLRNPVTDIKAVVEKATEYSEEGNSRLAREPELNGLFPNKDLYEKLKMVVSETEEDYSSEADYDYVEEIYSSDEI